MHKTPSGKSGLLDRLIIFFIAAVITGFAVFAISTLVVFPVRSMESLLLITLIFSVSSGLLAALWPCRLRLVVGKLLNG